MQITDTMLISRLFTVHSRLSKSQMKIFYWNTYNIRLSCNASHEQTYLQKAYLDLYTNKQVITSVRWFPLQSLFYPLGLFTQVMSSMIRFYMEMLRVRQSWPLTCGVILRRLIQNRFENIFMCRVERVLLTISNVERLEMVLCHFHSSVSEWM